MLYGCSDWGCFKGGALVRTTVDFRKKSGIRGEDGYKTFSVRLREETVVALEALAEKSNRSRNEVINIVLEQALDNGNIEVTE